MPSSRLTDLRRRIDRLDRSIVELLARRQSTVEDIAEVKEEQSCGVRDPEREAELMSRLRDVAREHDVSPDLVEDLFGTIIEHSVERQTERRSEPDASSTTAPRRTGHLRKVG